MELSAFAQDIPTYRITNKWVVGGTGPEYGGAGVDGDAFAEQDNFKQAKATFESIANGYESTGPEDDVLDAVAMRLEKLSQMM